MPIVASIKEEFENLLDQYEKKLITPNWFNYNVKTLLNKNITIEDWNKAMLQIKNVASEAEVLLEMCKFFANNLQVDVIGNIQEDVENVSNKVSELNEEVKNKANKNDVYNKTDIDDKLNQFVKTDGTKAMSGGLDMGNNPLLNCTNVMYSDDMLAITDDELNIILQ